MALTQEDLQAIAGLIRQEIQPMKDDIQLMKDDIQLMKDDIQSMKDDIQLMKDDIQTMKDEIQLMKDDIQTMKNDIRELNDKLAATNMHIENVTDKNLQLIAENYVELTKKLNQAIPVADKNLAYEVKVNYLIEEVEKLKQEMVELKNKIA